MRMKRKCPLCHQSNVRRSKADSSEPRLRRILLSPYRCRDCRARFWVVSRTTYHFVAAIAAVTLVPLIVNYVRWENAATPVGLSTEQVVRNAEMWADTTMRANKNEAASEYELAQRYSQGVGTGDAEEARKWLARAATHGYARAQYAYGLALLKGEGEPQDPLAATKWMMLSAEAGYAPAQFELGLMYQSGTGVVQSDAKAYTWLNLAAAAGVPGAATVRDSVLRGLSPAQIEQAQAEARAYFEAQSKRPPDASDVSSMN
jgi:uncharacterized protein